MSSRAPGGLSLRPALVDDLAAVTSLAHACIADLRARAIDQWDDIYPTRNRFSADVAAGSLYVASLPAQEVVAAFALDGQQDVEYATVPWTLLDGPVGVVHRFMVDPRYQGQGLARELMLFAEGLACELGFAILRLDAFSLNPAALRLYRGLGYHEPGDVLLRKGVFRAFEKRMGTWARAKQQTRPDMDG